MKCNQVGYETVTAITRKDLFSILQKNILCIMISYYMQDVLAHFSFRTIWCVNSEIQAVPYDSQMAFNNTGLLALW